jgi:hypothetical protein
VEGTVCRNRRHSGLRRHRPLQSPPVHGNRACRPPAPGRAPELH